MSGWSAARGRYYSDRPSLPAEPLLELVAARGGPRAAGVQPSSAAERALNRARVEGRVTYAAADRLAVDVLGVTPWEVWGAAYDA